MTSTRRGRLPSKDRAGRRQEVLDAALAELVERGAGAVTMAGVARRAGASKETLYSWFGNRDELLGTIVESFADATTTDLLEALGADQLTSAQARQTLITYGQALLMLLTSDASVALNRAAMASPALAARLLTSGRHRVGPHVEDFLVRLQADGVVDLGGSAAVAYRSLYGLIVRDTQIRVLLGEPAPVSEEIRAAATRGVDAFLRLFAPTDATGE